MLSFHYDKSDDLFEIISGQPKKAISVEVADDVFVRKEIKTGKIIGFTILNFEKWFNSTKERTIPLFAEFKTI